MIMIASNAHLEHTNTITFQNRDRSILGLRLEPYSGYTGYTIVIEISDKIKSLRIRWWPVTCGWTLAMCVRTCVPACVYSFKLNEDCLSLTHSTLAQSTESWMTSDVCHCTTNRFHLNVCMHFTNANILLFWLMLVWISLIRSLSRAVWLLLSHCGLVTHPKEWFEMARASLSWLNCYTVCMSSFEKCQTRGEKRTKKEEEEETHNEAQWCLMSYCITSILIYRLLFLAHSHTLSNRHNTPNEMCFFFFFRKMPCCLYFSCAINFVNEQQQQTQKCWNKKYGTRKFFQFVELQNGWYDLSPSLMNGWNTNVSPATPKRDALMNMCCRSFPFSCLCFFVAKCAKWGKERHQMHREVGSAYQTHSAHANKHTHTHERETMIWKWFEYWIGCHMATEPPNRHNLNRFL